MIPRDPDVMELIVTPAKSGGPEPPPFAILDARVRGHDREVICGILIPHHFD